MNTKPDWTNRKNITMPADMVDSIRRAALERDIKVYQLVDAAVDAYLRSNPVNGNGDAEATE